MYPEARVAGETIRARPFASMVASGLGVLDPGHAAVGLGDRLVKLDELL
jgi:hypothetical protein